MLNIVIPAAGRGSRFVAAGYNLPKPLIQVKRKAMAHVVIDNLRPTQHHRFIFMAQREHCKTFGLDNRLLEWAPGCEVVQIDGMTEGAACTVLMARQFINNDEPLMVANCDQFLDVPIDDFLAVARNHSIFDGLIWTMNATDPKWSFVKLDERHYVTEVAEKQPISDMATAGVYYFAKGLDFVWAAERMIEKNIRTLGEMYLAPAYNQLIAAGKRIGVFHNRGQVMWGLGTPEDLAVFVSNPVSEKVQCQPT